MHREVPDSGSTPELATTRAALESALIAAAGAKDYGNPDIRAAVIAYARAVRAAKRPPEWMIVDLKRLIHKEALKDVGEWFRTLVGDRAVSIGIAEYFNLSEK